MPTTDTGIYELLYEQSYGEEQVLNVYHFLHSLGDDDDQDLCAQAFDEDLVTPLSLVSNAVLKYDLIRVRNLTGTLADSVKVPSVSQGVISGEVIASFVAASIRYDRVSKDTRNGAKRIVGLVEADVVASIFTTPYFTKLQTLAAVLEQDIATVGAIFHPIILRKPPDEFGTYTYNEVASCTALNRVTTQNSRKIF